MKFKTSRSRRFVTGGLGAVLVMGLAGCQANSRDLSKTDAASMRAAFSHRGPIDLNAVDPKIRPQVKGFMDAYQARMAAARAGANGTR